MNVVRNPKSRPASTRENSRIVRRVWLCWFQGLRHLETEGPCVNRAAVAGWVKLNPTWQVVVITKENVDDYLPEFNLLVSRSRREHTHAARSDLLRLLLLKKYGGVWADASLVPSRPLDEWIYFVVNECGFFTFRYLPRRRIPVVGDRETVAWFLVVAYPDHALMNLWAAKFCDNFLNAVPDVLYCFGWFRVRRWRYFQINHDLCELYDSNLEARSIIDAMVYIDPQHAYKYNLQQSIKLFSFPRLPKGRKKFCEFFVYKRPHNLDLKYYAELVLSDDDEDALVNKS